jgi:ABC-type dipeptide/oligopeptide/nickel transport system permease component
VTRGTLVYIIQRLAIIALTLLVVSFVVFVVVHALPGNAFISQRVHGKTLQLLLHEYGLDQPVLIQYWNFLKGAIHGNLGVSLYIRGEAVTPLVLRELSVSCELGGSALIITIGLGMTFGVLAAIRQNTWVDYLLTSLAVIGYTVPSFVIAGLGIMIFADFLGSVTGGAFAYSPVWTGTYGTIGELWLPALSIGLYTSGQITRITRASMLEVIQQDYIRTARAKGLFERTIRHRHVLRNSLIPIATLVGLSLPSVLTAALMVEYVFNFQGLGLAYYNAALTTDYPVELGITVLIGIATVVGNLIADLAYAVLDPRVRYRSS